MLSPLLNVQAGLVACCVYGSDTCSTSMSPLINGWLQFLRFNCPLVLTSKRFGLLKLLAISRPGHSQCGGQEVLNERGASFEIQSGADEAAMLFEKVSERGVRK